MSTYPPTRWEAFTSVFRADNIYLINLILLQSPPRNLFIFPVNSSSDNTVDIFAHTSEISFDLNIRNPYYLESKLLKIKRSVDILFFAFSLVVLISVELHYKFCFRAIKVGYKSSENLLPRKFYRIKILIIPKNP